MQTFKKAERLHGRQLIQQLFAEGKSFTLTSFRVIWVKAELKSQYPVEMLIGVPKKNIKKAVLRNRIKRRIREAYRRHKKPLYESLTSKGIACKLMLIYTGKDEIQYKEVEIKINQIIQRLIKENEETVR